MSVLQIQLTETAERRLREEAAKRNASPEELAASVLTAWSVVPVELTDDKEDSEEVSEEIDDAAIEAMFTPERLDHINRSLQSIEQGQFVTQEQLDAELSETRTQWLSRRRA
jgi:predicted transcriptional regulator